MHRPGYVQGGQEVGCGYLLLGIYYRRIPGDIHTHTQKRYTMFTVIFYDVSFIKFHKVLVVIFSSNTSLAGWKIFLEGRQYYAYMRRVKLKICLEWCRESGKRDHFSFLEETFTSNFCNFCNLCYYISTLSVSQKLILDWQQVYSKFDDSDLCLLLSQIRIPNITLRENYQPI
jgi:Pyruvate/2-oxoacid:ferredoxin oxidoreductase delta subunit